MNIRENINNIFEFLKNNPLFILLPALFIALMCLKPFRKMLAYFAKNIIPLAFFFLLSGICSFFGYTLSINIFSVIATLLLGLPGISLALFLSLVI
ncbi:MAG: hypothetical protein FWD71_20990 [Oscillospiraceae bacterium]|nr:hypothetical protein [Oscillospiraceae bacterium]